ncbi:hypothetical protein Tco_0127806 [Tanacetum coccineum]
MSNFMASQDARLSRFEDDFKLQQSEMTNKISTVLKAITYRITVALPSDTVKNLELNVPQSPNTEFVCTKDDDGDVMFIEIIRKYEDSREEELEEDENTMT